MDGPTVPIVYSVSFSDPASYFLATRVQMHNKDVIFGANAQSVEITKLRTFLNALLSVPLQATTGTLLQMLYAGSLVFTYLPPSSADIGACASALTTCP
jgi:hypothetical protein